MRRLQLPLSLEERKSLRAGEEILLTGTLYTARDAAHKRLVEMIQNNEPLPMNLQDITIYYVGPTPAKENQVIGSCGPTTSSRMDPYVKPLAERGMACMLGKGRRNDEVKQCIQDFNMIYFVCVGGAGAYLSKCVKHREMVAFDDLLAEAITKLEVEDFPCFVGIDTKGNDIYDESKKLL